MLQKKIKHATGVYKSDLDINKVVNVPTNLRNSETKVDHLDVAKLKVVPVDLKIN